MKRRKNKLKLLPFPLIQLTFPANFTFLVLWDMAVTSTGWKRLWEQKNKVKGKGGFVNRSWEVLWRSFPSFYVWGEVWEGNGVNSAIKAL